MHITTLNVGQVSHDIRNVGSMPATCHVIQWLVRIARSTDRSPDQQIERCITRSPHLQINRFA